MSIITGKKVGKRIIRFVDSIIDLILLIIILLLVAFAGFAIWDSNQVYKEANSDQYAVYKPTENDSLSFQELQKVNSEVFSWLTIYGTNIDYPVTQSEDNEKYVNTNAMGKYSLAGSIFLDHTNDKSYKDFNSILYGHHMEKKAMFGEIGSFKEESFFDARKYGNLFFNGRNHGLEIFAFVEADAYDGKIFSPNIQDEQLQQDYLEALKKKAMYYRDIGVTIKDRIILMSTCSSDSTNGRDILVAKLSNSTFGNQFDLKQAENTKVIAEVNKQANFLENIPTRFFIPIILILLILIIILIIMFVSYKIKIKNRMRHKRRRRDKKLD